MKFWFNVVVLFLSLSLISPAYAIPVNNDVALTSFKGQVLVREQVRYTRKSNDNSPQNRTIHRIVIPNVISYGVTEKINLLTTYPIVYTEMSVNTPQGRMRRDASGFGDLKILGKYRAWKSDGVGKTTLVNLLGGLELPTGNTNAKDSLGKLPRTIQPGKGSWNPIVGATFKAETFRHEFNATASWTFNTEGHGFEFGDVLNHTAAYQFRVWPWKFNEETSGLPTYVFVGVEANGILELKNKLRGSTVDASGGYTLFLSPTVQMISRRVITELSVQLPVISVVNGEQPERELGLAGGFRVQF